MIRDNEMRRILIKLFKKQKKRPPPIQLCRDEEWVVRKGTFFDEYKPPPPGCNQ